MRRRRRGQNSAGTGKLNHQDTKDTKRSQVVPAMPSPAFTDDCRGSFDRQCDADLFGGGVEVAGDFGFGVADVVANSLNLVLGVAELFVGDGLGFMAFAVAADVDAEEIAGFFDLFHGFVAVAFVVVVGLVERFVGFAKDVDFTGVVGGIDGGGTLAEHWSRPDGEARGTDDGCKAGNKKCAHHNKDLVSERHRNPPM